MTQVKSIKRAKKLCKNAESNASTLKEQRLAAGYKTKEELAAAAYCSLRTVATCEKLNRLPITASTRELYVQALKAGAK